MLAPLIKNKNNLETLHAVLSIIRVRGGSRRHLRATCAAFSKVTLSFYVVGDFSGCTCSRAVNLSSPTWGAGVGGSITSTHNVTHAFIYAVVWGGGGVGVGLEEP